MDDKNLLEDMLFTVKGGCNLYLNGTVESETAEIRNEFNTNLNDMLTMQNTIYSKMSDKGWYPSEKAQSQKIEKAAQKYSKPQN